MKPRDQHTYDGWDVFAVVVAGFLSVIVSPILLGRWVWRTKPWK